MSEPAQLGLPHAETAYHIGVGDKVRVAVFGEDNLSGTFDVAPSGAISMPLVGEMQARGLTVAELKENLTKKLEGGYLRQPKVNVDVLNYRPIYIFGEVRNSGELPYKTGMRLRDAIALAGGYSYRADEGYVLLGRGDRPEQRVRLTGESPLLPGDNIRVPERIF